jgi:hypothetical protein
MTNYFERIIDAVTGEETIRPYTAKEVAEVESAQAQAAKDAAERDSTQTTMNAARQVILDKLGITQEEASLLLS